MKIVDTEEIRELIGLIKENLDQSLNESDSFNEYLSQLNNIKSHNSFTSSILLNAKDYESNPYLKICKNARFKRGNIEFKIDKYYPFDSFLYDEVVTSDNDFTEINPIGHFNREFSYPVLYKGNTPWMSIIPHEINTMKKPIEEATGNVLTFGCGLGYYAFMVSNKPEVKSVTIVDNDPNVISIFTEKILPSFPCKEKIKVINANCFKFCEKSNIKYDYLFVDTYHTPEDGLPFFIKLQPYLNKISKKNYFWIMPSMITYFKRYLLFVFIDIFNGDITEDDFVVTGEDILDDILAQYIIKTKGIILSDITQVMDFFSDETILKTLSSIN